MRILRIALFVLLVAVARATVYTEFYVQTTASNLNAGSTTADAAAFTYTSAVLAGGWNSATGVFTVASGNPSGDGVAVGDFASVYVTAGATVATFVGRITARDTTTITVSLTAVGGTPPATDALGGTTIKVGGAWKGPNAAVAFPFGFASAAMNDGTTSHYPRVNFKSGVTYAITAAMTHSINTGPVTFEGYTTTVGDGGFATIDGGSPSASYVLLTVSGSNVAFRNFIGQNNGTTTGTSNLFAFSGNGCYISRVVAHASRGPGISISGAGSIATKLEAYDCVKGGTSGQAGIAASGAGVRVSYSISHSNTTTNANGFSGSNTTIWKSCIAAENAAAGFRVTSTGASIEECDAWSNGGDGADFTSASATVLLVKNSNFLKNGGFGINSSGGSIRMGRVENCGFGTGTQVNTSGDLAANISVPVSVGGSITYASNATPWSSPSTGDFRVTLAAAKGTGNGTFTESTSYTGTVAYPDVGAAQSLGTSQGQSVSSFIK